MKWILPLSLLAACTTTPVAYVGACPHDDWRCQRNADAQTLRYIGESDAAVRLMCADEDLAPFMGESCSVLPAVY